MTVPTRIRSFGEAYSPTFVDRFGVWLSGRQIHRWVDFRGKRVADFGCGFHAAFSRTLLGNARIVHLADLHISPELKVEKRVRVHEGPLPVTLPSLESESIDVVLCVSVLEHLNDPEAALHHFHRLLAPEGVCVVNVPSWRGKWFLETSAFRLGLSPAEEMEDHKMYYDPKDLWPLLVRAGFRPSRIHCFTHKFGLNTFAVCRREGM